MSGINIGTYYASKMYETILGPGSQTILFAGFTALAYFAGAMIAVFLVDRVGHRPLFMAGSCKMVVCLTLMAVFYKVAHVNNCEKNHKNCGCQAQCTFGTTWVCVDWLYNLYSRLNGSSLEDMAYAYSKSVNPAETSLFRTRAKAWNLVALFVVWKWFIETKGKSLEEIDAVFNDSAGAIEIDDSKAGSNL
ncbi:hypothetical protein [Parasitella parasitica]|uniref:Major facilitator superfamily (MFS) profile domain-containing protein n=1 Tax=Parasitella parasitica TaxID=35722 RepID=A0A0B7N9Y7_9FUNG|nr:hypothetical protein [Parasitella parasitica]